MCWLFRSHRSRMFGVDEILGEKPTAEAPLMLLKPVMVWQGLSHTVVLGRGLKIGYSTPGGGTCL